MDVSTSAFKTRLAPSPTGHLHLGHVLHLIYVQGIAKAFGASIDLRMEDHDLGRCRPEFEASILRDLAWLGVKVPTNLWRQSERGAVYQRQFENLMRRGMLYACRCSRSDIQAITGQVGGELIYPGTCRDKNYPLDAPNCSIRLKLDGTGGAPQAPSVASMTFRYTDVLLGPREGTPSRECGDIVIRDRNGQWTYQFTVVIDDLEQGINLIIRGQDLLSSTARQLAMRHILSPGSPQPIYAHHPLLTDTSGEKLAKRNSSEAIASLRHEGATADEVRGLAAFMGKLQTSPEPRHDTSGLNFNLKNPTV